MKNTFKLVLFLAAVYSLIFYRQYKMESEKARFILPLMEKTQEPENIYTPANSKQYNALTDLPFYNYNMPKPVTRKHDNSGILSVSYAAGYIFK